jgi:hypothetical protein
MNKKSSNKSFHSEREGQAARDYPDFYFISFADNPDDMKMDRSSYAFLIK